MNSTIWNERYGQTQYAYGVNPNDFLKSQLTTLKPATILFPAEGEGRNAVYAATKGWTAFAFDQSEEGQKKALILANKNNVSINYIVNNFHELPYKAQQFDAIALIYAHFPANTKSAFHKALVNYLKPGGTIIFEAFSKKHIEYNSKNPGVGGPKDLDTLFSIEEIKNDFAGFETLLLEEKVIELNEGLYHNGQGSVIRFVGKKV